MNEDYYYDTEPAQETDPAVNAANYYNPAPYTRYQYFKSMNMDKIRRNFRGVGIAILVLTVIDFLRIWNVNTEYDIESYLKLYMLLGGSVLILEIVNQRLINPILTFLGAFCCIIIAYGATKTFLFLFIPGFVNMILFIVHFEQVKTFERKYRLYREVNDVE